MDWKTYSYVNPLDMKICPFTSKAFGERYYEVNKNFMEKNPIMKRENYDKIKDLLEKNDVIIVEAATGSGKSINLIPIIQRIYNYQRRILMSEPTIISVKKTAHIIADQLGLEVGKNVGYIFSGGHEESSEKNGNLVHIATDYFLTKLIGIDDADPLYTDTDPLIRKSNTDYDIIIIDEVHQRKIDSDIFMAFMHMRMQNKEFKGKLILLSATIDVTKFVSYFSKVAKTGSIFIEGRTFNIEDIYIPVGSTEPKDVVVKVIEVVSGLLDNTIILKRKKDNQIIENSGDILVFCPTLGFIKDVLKSFEKNKKYDDVTFRALDSKIPQKDKEDISGKPEDTYMKKGYKRRVVFSTNVAETGITIEGIKFVIETGLYNRVIYEQETNKKVQFITYINQSNSIQRCGRAGRLTAGTCIKLYSEEDFNNKFYKYNKPEILDSTLYKPLLSILYLVKKVEIAKIVFSHLPDRPSEELLTRTIMDFYTAGVIEKDGTISNLGKTTTAMGVDYELAMLVIESYIYNLSKFMIPIVVLLKLKMKLKSVVKDEVLVQMLINKWGEPISVLKFYLFFKKDFLEKQTEGVAIDNKKMDDWCRKYKLDSRLMRNFLKEIKEITRKIFRVGEQSVYLKESAKRREYKDMNEVYQQIIMIFKKIYPHNVAIYVPSKKQYGNVGVDKKINYIGIPDTKFIDWKTKPSMIGYTDIVYQETGPKLEYPYAVIHEENMIEKARGGNNNIYRIPVDSYDSIPIYDHTVYNIYYLYTKKKIDVFLNRKNNELEDKIKEYIVKRDRLDFNRRLMLLLLNNNDYDFVEKIIDNISIMIHHGKQIYKDSLLSIIAILAKCIKGNNTYTEILQDAYKFVHKSTDSRSEPTDSRSEPTDLESLCLYKSICEDLGIENTDKYDNIIPSNSTRDMILYYKLTGDNSIISELMKRYKKGIFVEENGENKYIWNTCILINDIVDKK